MNGAPSVGEMLTQARARLHRAGIETAALDARVLAAHALGMSAEELVVRDAEPVCPRALARLRGAVTRRAGGEPVAYITGLREFWSLEFEVGPGCLVPRPDSEAVVAAMLDALRGWEEAVRILDLGTGTGCLLLALLSERPSAQGIGIDLDWRAVHTARANARRLGLADRAAFLRGDWAAAVKGPFDAVVANPPYIPSADIPGLAPCVREFEPATALDGGADGLEAMRAMMVRLGQVMTPGGLAAVEFGPGQAEAVERLGRELAGLHVQGLIVDLAGRSRGMMMRRPGI